MLESKMWKKHPKTCSYFLRGTCWRTDVCSYLHAYSEQRVDNLKVIDDKLDIEKVNDDVEEDMITEEINNAKDMENEISVGCGHKCDKCEIVEAKNECEQCGQYFFSTCEIRVHGRSALEFMNENNFQNYTCNTVHY